MRAGKKEIDWERARKSMTARLSDQQNVLPMVIGEIETEKLIQRLREPA